MPSLKNALYHMYSDDEPEEEEIEEEDNSEKIWNEVCKLNQEEMDFINDISQIGVFVRFYYYYPKTDHWNVPKPYRNVRSLFYKNVDEYTLNLISSRKGHFDYTGEGNFSLNKDLVKTLFDYADRWCYYHNVHDVFWVASCIVQFSCI